MENHRNKQTETAEIFAAIALIGGMTVIAIEIIINLLKNIL